MTKLLWLLFALALVLPSSAQAGGHVDATACLPFALDSLTVHLGGATYDGTVLASLDGPLVKHTKGLLVSEGYIEDAPRHLVAWIMVYQHRRHYFVWFKVSTPYGEPNPRGAECIMRVKTLGW